MQTTTGKGIWARPVDETTREFANEGTEGNGKTRLSASSVLSVAKT